MAVLDNTSQVPALVYNQCPWGDLIYGTKEQLQGLGLAVGLAFPGEEGGPNRQLTVTDSRGFKCRINNDSYFGDGFFSASIPLPGREQPEEEWVTVASGVRMKKSNHTDDYVGTADALATAGLLRLDQLPGQPGMRKVSVTIFPDGSIPKGCPTANSSEARAPGAKLIRRASTTTYEVSVRIDKREYLRRDNAYMRRRDEWEARMMAMPRPAPLSSTLSVFAKNEKTRIIPKCRTIGNVIYLPKAKR